MKIKPATLINMVKSIGLTKKNEISCNGCYEKLEQFVELLENGEDPSVILPQVQHHIDMCGNCSEEFNALLISMKATNNL